MSAIHEALVRAWLRTSSTVRERLDRAGRDDSGLTTTEWAVLTAGAAAIAIVVVAIVKQKAEGIGNNIPTKP